MLTSLNFPLVGLHFYFMQQYRKNGKDNSLLLGQCRQPTLGNLDDLVDVSKRSKNAIYFNSVAFNGNQFLTDSAIDAGYTSRSMKPDASLIENGLASIVEQDVTSMIVSAENTLFRILVNDESARTTVKNMLSARRAVKYGGDIQWSCPEKEWLFELLVGGLNSLQETNCHRSQLRVILAQRPDVPPGAFGKDVDDDVTHRTTLVSNDLSEFGSTSIDTSNPNEQYNDVPVGLTVVPPAIVDCGHNDAVPLPISQSMAPASTGSLDVFFVEDCLAMEMVGDEFLDGTRNDLAVQETLVSLLWASTVLKSKLIRNELASYSNFAPKAHHLTNNALSDDVDGSTVGSDEAFRRQGLYVENSTDNNLLFQPEPVDPSEDAVSIGKGKGHEKDNSTSNVDLYQLELLSQLRDTTGTLQSLQESTNRIRTRLMDESSCTGIEGSISRGLQTELAAQLDDHVRDVWRNDFCPAPDINDEPYETALERMASEWGEWYDDDYVWSPTSENSNIETKLIAESGSDSSERDMNRESLDAFMERIDREWSDWID
jgi:hypothetical protein